VNIFLCENKKLIKKCFAATTEHHLIQQIYNKYSDADLCTTFVLLALFKMFKII